MTPGAFTCTRCGAVHPGPPSAYGSPAPVHWEAIPEHERARRGFLDEELCAIDDQHFFVRARIILPVRDAAEDFEWGVWVSLSRPNWERTRELWRQRGREREPPYFGWLSNELPGYPSTLNLKTLVHTQPMGERPRLNWSPPTIRWRSNNARGSRGPEWARSPRKCCTGLTSPSPRRRGRRLHNRPTGAGLPVDDVAAEPVTVGRGVVTRLTARRAR